MDTYRKIDFHAHIFPAKIREKAVRAISEFYGIPMGRDGGPTDLIKSGSTIGVETYVVHSVATAPRQVSHVNDFIAEETKKHKEFIGFATLHPFMEDMEEEVERVISLGFRGVKLHPDFQEFYTDDDKAAGMYRRIGGRVPILIHVGDERRKFSEPVRLRRMMERFPDQVFIGAHFGGYSVWGEAEKYLIGQNLYIDTCSSLFKLDKEKAVELIRRHGPDKVLFGTDYPMWDHEGELRRFMALPLTDEEREKIFYKNAAKLLGL